MNEQAIRFRIGIFVLAALILLAVLITLFGKLPNYFKPTTSYTISFANAQGVGPGTPVRRSGVKIGEVRSLQLDNDTGNVKVNIQVDAGYTLRKGDRPTLLQSLLGGDVVISFEPPEEKDLDVTPVEPGAVLTGNVQVDPGALLQRIDKLAQGIDKLGPGIQKVLPNADETLNEIKKAAQSLDKLIGKLGPGVEKVLPNANESLVEIKKAAQSMDKVLQKVDKMTPSVEKFVQTLDKMAPKIDEAVTEIRDLAKSAKTIMPDVRKTLDEVQLTARNWGKVGERVDLLVRTNEDKVTKTLDQASETIKRVGDVFSDENQRNIRDTLKNVRVSSDRLDTIARGTEEFIKEGRVTLKKMNDSFTQINDVLVNIQKATKPIADRGESIVRNLDEGTDKLNKTMGDLRELIQVVARGDGTIQRLLSDPSLFHNLNEAMCSANKMMPRLDRILQDVGIFADRLARHPELLGVRGAIVPSSGLKESPTPYKIMPNHP